MHLPLPKVPNRKKLKPMKRIAVMVNPDDHSVPVSSMAANAAPAAGAIMPAKDDLIPPARGVAQAHAFF